MMARIRSVDNILEVGGLKTACTLRNFCTTTPTFAWPHPHFGIAAHALYCDWLSITVAEYNIFWTITLCYNAKKSWGALAPLAPSPPSTLLGMIVLELNSVTRMHNEISFSDDEMPAAHHNPEFHFSILNRIISLITNQFRVHFSKCNETYI